MILKHRFQLHQNFYTYYSLSPRIADNYQASADHDNHVFFFSSRRRHTTFDCDWSSDVCSSDLNAFASIPIGARTRTAPKRMVRSRLAFATKITRPKPRSAPVHSPMTAPIRARFSEMRAPEKRYGSALGTRRWRKISRPDAPRVSRNATSCRSAERRPTNEFTNIGKNVISAAMATLGAVPKPNQSVKSGATATIGVSFTRIARGKRVRSKGRDHAMTVASANATPEIGRASCRERV